MRLLVVEDETRLAAYLKRGLEADGHAVDVYVWRGGSSVDLPVSISGCVGHVRIGRRYPLLI